MIFTDVIKNHYSQPGVKITDDPRTITVYPLGDLNLEGVKVLLDNCKRHNTENNNVRVATVDPTLWIGKFLDKHYQKLSFVSISISFEIHQVINGSIFCKSYKHDYLNFNSELELDNYMESMKWKTIVIHSITKEINLDNLNTKFTVRICEIGDSTEERDKKIKEVLK